MYAFYNKSTSKFLYMYAWSYYDDTNYALEQEGSAVYVNEHRSVLEQIQSTYEQHMCPEGDDIRKPAVDPGVLDGYEIVKLGMVS